MQAIDIRSASNDKVQVRVQAVLALLRGEPPAQVTSHFGICRSSLYKFRHRALDALSQALLDQKPGAQTPHNHLCKEQEAQVHEVCTRHPTASSYQIHERLGADAPSSRTIQRVRGRLAICRLPKRPIPHRPAVRLSELRKQQARTLINLKPFLGPERLAWDLQNQYGIQISPATMKRLKRRIYEEAHPPAAPAVWRFYERQHPHSLWHGDYLEKVTLTDIDRTAFQLTLLDDYSRAYVFCDLFTDPDLLTTIHALITAMRQWQTIPQAVLFDNASNFRGKLLQAFCHNLGIRLIHSAINHPQTNGKLERALRDDMREFYKQQPEWLLDPLRRALPDYVHYRNNIRGHQALQGKPSSKRLEEQHWQALPAVLDRLESYAECEVKSRIIPASGSFGFLGRDAYVDRALRGKQVRVFETFYGLEVRSEVGGRYLLRDHRLYNNMYKQPFYRRAELPHAFRFEPVTDEECPRIAVAL